MTIPKRILVRERYDNSELFDYSTNWIDFGERKNAKRKSEKNHYQNNKASRSDSCMMIRRFWMEKSKVGQELNDGSLFN